MLRVWPVCRWLPMRCLPIVRWRRGRRVQRCRTRWRCGLSLSRREANANGCGRACLLSVLAYDGLESAAPVRSFRICSAATCRGPRSAGAAAVANADLLDGFCEGQVPSWNGRSPRNPTQAPSGRMPPRPRQDSRDWMRIGRYRPPMPSDAARSRSESRVTRSRHGISNVRLEPADSEQARGCC